MLRSAVAGASPRPAPSSAVFPRRLSLPSLALPSPVMYAPKGEHKIGVADLEYCSDAIVGPETVRKEKRRGAHRAAGKNGRSS